MNEVPKPSDTSLPDSLRLAHQHDLGPWQHAHDFSIDRSVSERRAWMVVGITLVMMTAEVSAGWWWHSMALLADGWHMGTHAVAIGVSGLSYWLTRRWACDRRFSLGPWKIEVLGAYTSALLLAVVAMSVTAESVLRLLRPEAVAYDESLVMAAIGLVVNVVCAWLLHDAHAHAGHVHEHGHVHPHEHGRGHEDHGTSHGETDTGSTLTGGHDLNREAAYAHVLADAMTSVLALAALGMGKWLGWYLLDPLVGLLGAGLIAWWARGLLARSATILLDREMDHPLANEVRTRMESDGDTRVADLHLWRVGADVFACAVTLVADLPRSADAYRERLRDLPSLAHVMVEINRCRTVPMPAR
jgi:cation diffusion facilitator family transporter